MGFALAMLGAAVLAGLAGFYVRRWWLLAAALVVGAAVIAIDLSTRDLATSGHDDTLLVAIAEVLLLALVATGAGCGIALGKRRA
jgi:hypothetical protein